MDLIVFIGLQGSGKTTFFQDRFATEYVHISKDHFRKARNRERKQTLLLREALSDGKSVVVDNTNPTEEERAAILSLATEFSARKVGYYFESLVADCKARNEARDETNRVPDVAIHSTIKRLARPSYQEGFDELFHVRIAEGGFVVTDWREEDES